MMGIKKFWLIASLLLLPLQTVSAGDMSRVALVIGNAAYQHASQLPNPPNDARLMARVLEGAGFQLVDGKPLIDVDKPTLEKAIRKFGQELRGGAVGLFYYSGHGVQVKGANYLVPVTANLTAEVDVDYELVDAGLVLKAMEAANNRLNIVILDACRNNPFGGRGLRALSSGLAQVSAPSGTIISYATQPGNVARDGEGANSPYTAALAEAIRRPGLDVFSTFNQVGLLVAEATGEEQKPWFSSSPIAGQFVFTVGDALTTPEAPDNTRLTGLEEKRKAEEARLAVLAQKSKEAEETIRLAEAEAKSKAEEARLADLERQAAEARERIAATPSARIAEPPPPVSRPASASDGANMVSVRGGCFQMGSPTSEAGRFDNETQHQVCVQDFAMGKYAVTFAEYDRFASATGREKPGDQGWGRDRRPVINVSWLDAMAYAEWLSEQTGKRYRLPTEAEWEYAARAGTTTAYYWGDQVGRNNANCNSCGSQWDGRQTAPVGSFQPNRWGLYDMLGNVWQWTCSAWSNSYDGSEQRCQTTGDAYRVVRGGSWNRLPRRVRAAYRGIGAPSYRNDNLGFRLARTN